VQSSNQVIEYEKTGARSRGTKEHDVRSKETNEQKHKKRKKKPSYIRSCIQLAEINISFCFSLFQLFSPNTSRIEKTSMIYQYIGGKKVNVRMKNKSSKNFFIDSKNRQHLRTTKDNLEESKDQMSVFFRIQFRANHEEIRESPSDDVISHDSSIMNNNQQIAPEPKIQPT
jgi:hypothetical protein